MKHYKTTITESLCHIWHSHTAHICVLGVCETNVLQRIAMKKRVNVINYATKWSFLTVCVTSRNFEVCPGCGRFTVPFKLAGQFSADLSTVTIMLVTLLTQTILDAGQPSLWQSCIMSSVGKPYTAIQSVFSH